MQKSQRIAVFCQVTKKDSIYFNPVGLLCDSSALIFIFIIYTIFTEPLQYLGGRNKDFVKKRWRYDVWHAWSIHTDCASASANVTFSEN